jgi:putative transposase
MIDTTNTLESLNRTLRKAIKTRASFANDEAALKLLFIAICHVGLRWHPAPAWAQARFIIISKDRFTGSAC